MNNLAPKFQLSNFRPTELDIKMRSKNIFLIAIFGLLVSCGEAIKEAEKEFMPPAQGGIGEILLVMDSAQWKGEIGKELKRTFHTLMPGLPQDEPMFKLHYINPRRFNSVLKQAKSIIFVTLLDDPSRESRILRSYFTQESLQRIRQEEKLFMFTKKDDFAKGQDILHLFGKDENTLLGNLRENKENIRALFENIEQKRLETSLFKSENRDLQKQLRKKHNFSIRVPYGYEVAKNDDNFIWIRQLEYPEEKSFFIYYEPYRSAEIFNKDGIADLRNRITYQMIKDVEDKDTYMMLQDEKYMPYYTKEINLNGAYAFEMRGLWKLSDISAGGPFVSYTTVDQKLGRLYYIEGYVYHPSGDKRDWIREMDAILQTFEVSDQEASQATD